MISHTKIDPPCLREVRTIITTTPDIIQTAPFTILFRMMALMQLALNRFRVLRVDGGKLLSRNIINYRQTVALDPGS